eukprot:jgi/Ulvmu1/3858/UM018_0077.1
MRTIASRFVNQLLLTDVLGRWAYPAARVAVHGHEQSANQGMPSGRPMGWSKSLAAVVAAVAATGTASYVASCDGAGQASYARNWDKRVFFKYEKKLREFSTHEKTFEYFSSQTHEGRQCMTASDVLRAVLAVYPPDSADWNRSGSLAGETAPKVDHALSKAAIDFMNDFDIDGDGNFSFDEFILFLVLLSMPLKDMQAIFTVMDTDGNGTLDKREFMGVVEGLMQFTGKSHHSKVARSGNLAASRASGDEPFIHKWFGKDGNGRLKLADFMQFLIDLHGIFDDLEFSILDIDQDGVISGLDLARSLASPASIKYIDSLLDRADTLPADLREARITRADFMATQQLVRKFHRIHVPLSFWQDTGHSCDMQSTQRLVQHACKTAVPEVSLQILFHVFRTKNGKLDSSALHSAMYSKYQHTNFSTVSSPGLFKCMLDCVNPVQP